MVNLVSFDSKFFIPPFALVCSFCRFFSHIKVDANTVFKTKPLRHNLFTKATLPHLEEGRNRMTSQTVSQLKAHMLATWHQVHGHHLGDRSTDWLGRGPLLSTLPSGNLSGTIQHFHLQCYFSITVRVRDPALVTGESKYFVHTFSGHRCLMEAHHRPQKCVQQILTFV